MTFFGNRIRYQFNQSPGYLKRGIENREKVVFAFKSQIARDKFDLHEQFNSAVDFLTRGVTNRRK
jgi:hypothetical protein